ncbi:unnamed protein product [Linum tenue]|uniref:TF-B3 domain-containing protein n=1 Tax=Linum tenue TaxID=586396 RepID=A0AAV0MY58_9ROSI|nr:unnamed protein product [Linum tenue]
MLLLKRLGEEGIITNERFLSSLCEMSRTSRKAVHEAIMMKPRHPCFLVFMKPINIFQTRVYIPAKFMKKHMSSPPETIRIIQPPQLDGMSTEEQQEQGGGWTIHVSVQDRGGLTLTKGLVEFVRESRIRMGDICVFELISSFPFVFKVSILRGGSAAD